MRKRTTVSELIHNLVGTNIAECSRGNTLAIKNVGQSQRVHHCCHHTNIVGGHTANTTASQLSTTSVIAATNHNNHLAVFDFLYFFGNPGCTLGIESAVKLAL